MFRKMGQTLVKVKRLSQHIKAVVEQEFKQKNDGVANISSAKQEEQRQTTHRSYDPKQNSGREGQASGELMSDIIINKMKQHSPKYSNAASQTEASLTKKGKMNTALKELESKRTPQLLQQSKLKQTIIKNSSKSNDEQGSGELNGQAGVTRSRLKNVKVKSGQIKLKYKKKEYSQITMENYAYVAEPIAIPANKLAYEQAMTQTMLEIEQDLSEALRQWKWTQKAYDHALGFDQVEYCIYQMMAAEQKYRMILIKARSLQVEWSKFKGDLI